MPVYHFSIPFLLAWRNLTHDRGRFIVTLVGIAFSVILLGMQVGLLLNFISTTTTIVTHSNADIFITAPGVQSADMSTPQSERRRYQAWSVAGVEKAEPISVDFSVWKRPNGVTESIILVGIMPNATMSLPWDLEDNADPRTLLSMPDGVIIDRLYAEKLGVTGIGEIREINGVRVRIVGFTQGIRTFTQSPFVFTSLNNARRMLGLGDKHISYVLIKATAGYDLAHLRDTLQQRVPDTTVIIANDFAHQSAFYWLFTTGAGITLIMAAVLGILIGGAIVAQTLYASTMERLPEYATLRAIGGSSRYLYRIVLTQATLAGIIGYAIGILIVWLMVWSGRNASAAPELPMWLAATIGITTIIDCIAAAGVSLRVVTKIDPAKVFR